MSTEESNESVMEVIVYFQDLLHAWGFPIIFDQSLIRQVEGCLELFELCEGDVAEIRKLIYLYCQDDWWRRNHPYLDTVAKRITHLQEHDTSYLAKSWEEP